jgi:uncharacterized protein (TIGR02145 family)
MRSLLLIFCLLFVGVCNSQTTGTITDSRDGKVYKTVVIGNQTWMAENLNVATFRNGDPIPEAKTDEEWIKAGKNKQPAWCYYNNDPKNGHKYGKLYNWHAVNDKRGLAPEGWNIPSQDDWSILVEYLGGLELAGQKMQSTNGWFENKNGTNESGFLGLPSGSRRTIGEFWFIGENCVWWSSIENDLFGYSEKENKLISAWGWTLDFNYGLVGYDGNKAEGLSVRCLKDL